MNGDHRRLTTHDMADGRVNTTQGPLLDSEDNHSNYEDERFGDGHRDKGQGRSKGKKVKPQYDQQIDE